MSWDPNKAIVVRNTNWAIIPHAAPVDVFAVAKKAEQEKVNTTIVVRNTNWAVAIPEENKFKRLLKDLEAIKVVGKFVDLKKEIDDLEREIAKTSLDWISLTINNIKNKSHAFVVTRHDLYHLFLFSESLSETKTIDKVSSFSPKFYPKSFNKSLEQ